MARSYAIVGTGALGGYYGAKLHHAGLDVRFLLHSDYEHVRTHGLRVEAKEGDLCHLLRYSWVEGDRREAEIQL